MLTEIIVPIFVCVILPVAVVFIVGRTKQNEINRKTEVMIKAIENGAQIDPEMFKNTEPAPKAPKTLKQELVEKLTGGCVVTLIAMIAGTAIMLLDPFHSADTPVYIVTLAIMGGVVWESLSLLRLYNKSCSNALPQFESHQGGELL